MPELSHRPSSLLGFRRLFFTPTLLVNVGGDYGEFRTGVYSIYLLST